MKIGIITDIHEDYLRLKETVRKLERLQCDDLICLGDITGFDVRHYQYLSARDASGCIAVIRDNCKYSIPGNHDLFNARMVPKRKGLYDFPGTWYDMDFDERKKAGQDKIWLYEDHDLPSRIGKKETEYIRGLPDFVILETEGVRFMFSHSVVPDISGSAVWRPRGVPDFKAQFGFMAEHHCQTGFSGHFHPAGAEIATPGSYRFRSFGLHKIPADLAHYIVPCTASGSGYDGFSLLDTRAMTLEIFPVRSKRKWFERFT